MSEGKWYSYHLLSFGLFGDLYSAHSTSHAWGGFKRVCTLPDSGLWLAFGVWSMAYLLSRAHSLSLSFSLSQQLFLHPPGEERGARGDG